MKPIVFLSMLTYGLLISCYSTKVLSIKFPEPIIKTYNIAGTKDELFLKANLWMVATFKDPRSIIQYSDKTEGIITGKYLLKYIPFTSSHKVEEYSSPTEQNIFALIEIRLKDGKAYISIKPNDLDYYQAYYPGGKPINTIGGYTKEIALADIEALYESFSKSIQSPDVNF